MMMSFILDGILIAVCLIVIITSVKRGFVKTILSIVATVAAMLVAVVFTPGLSGVIYDGFMLESVRGGISGTISSLSNGGDAAGIENMFDKMPDALSEILERYGVDSTTLSDMIAGAGAGEETVESISSAIAAPVASAISSALAFLAIFIVAAIVLKIVIAIIDSVFRLPVLNSANRIAGLILGLVLSAVIIFVYCPAVAGLVRALGALSPAMFGDKAVDGTVIVKFFAEHNIFGVIESVLTESTKNLPRIH